MVSIVTINNPRMSLQKIKRLTDSNFLLHSSRIITFLGFLKMSVEKVAIVTGGNKGIGYAIVKGLCEKYTGKVYLTSRDVSRGNEAIAKLKELGFNPSYHELDIDSQTSVDKFKEYIKQTYGGIDILINNAAIAFKNDATEPFGVQADATIKTNYFGTLRVSEALIPLLRENAKLINLSSSAGHLSRIPSKDLRKSISNADLTVTQLNDLMMQFVKAAKEDSNVSNTWGPSAYVVSKVGVSALTRIHQKMLDSEKPSQNISVNCCHPGYVDTDMTSHKGPLTIEEGAVSTLYLALEPHKLRGQYVWKDCSVVDWLAPSAPVPH